ncbi:MAG: hypothetical protein M1820_000944 [Bogoriella megaspora]|nr:MAG: hypothetical protein M1820_000944 [Bogoriella megaspora]
MEGFSVTAGEREAENCQSSVLGVASFADVLFRAIAKVHAFWKSIKDAPQDVAAIVLDLELLQDILRDFCSLDNSQEIGNSTALSKARMLCSIKIQGLAGIVNDLEHGFKSEEKYKRTWAACKTARKKERLKDFRVSLGDTKLSLSLALQCSLRIARTIPQENKHPTELIRSNSVLQQHISNPKQLTSNTVSNTSKTSASVDRQATQQQDLFDQVVSLTKNAEINRFSQTAELTTTTSGVNAIEAHVQALREEIKTQTNIVAPSGVLRAQESSIDAALQGHRSNLASPRRSCGRRGKGRLVDYHDSIFHTIFGHFYFRTESRKSIRVVDDEQVEQIEATSLFKYHPSTWLISLGLKYSMIVSFQGHNIILTPSRAVSDNAIVFKLCKRGNVDAVRLLFEKGEASVLDTNSVGMQPLHWAVKGGQYEMSKFLLLCGADVNARNYLDSIT